MPASAARRSPRPLVRALEQELDLVREGERRRSPARAPAACPTGPDGPEGSVSASPGHGRMERVEQKDGPLAAGVHDAGGAQLGEEDRVRSSALRAPASAAARASPASGGPAVRPCRSAASRGRAVGGGRGRPVEHGEDGPLLRLGDRPRGRPPPSARALVRSRVRRRRGPGARRRRRAAPGTGSRPSSRARRSAPRGRSSRHARACRALASRSGRPRRQAPRRRRAACGGGSFPCRRPARGRRSANRSRREIRSRACAYSAMARTSAGASSIRAHRSRRLASAQDLTRRAGSPGIRPDACHHGSMRRTAWLRWWSRWWSPRSWRAWCSWSSAAARPAGSGAGRAADEPDRAAHGQQRPVQGDARRPQGQGRRREHLGFVVRPVHRGGAGTRPTVEALRRSGAVPRGRHRRPDRRPPGRSSRSSAGRIRALPTRRARSNAGTGSLDSQTHSSTTPPESVCGPAPGRSRRPISRLRSTRGSPPLPPPDRSGGPPVQRFFDVFLLRGLTHEHQFGSVQVPPPRLPSLEHRRSRDRCRFSIRVRVGAAREMVSAPPCAATSVTPRWHVCRRRASHDAAPLTDNAAFLTQMDASHVRVCAEQRRFFSLSPRPTVVGCGSTKEPTTWPTG